MARKLTYKELEQRVKELEKETSKRKQAEEALRNSEQEKVAILDSMTELVAYQDTEMRVLWANRAAGESVGLAPEKLVGRYCYEIWQQRAKPCVGCPVNEAIKTKQIQETEMTTPDGRVWFIRGNPVQDANGNITGGLETTIDITERKQAEEALKESRDAYQTIFETTGTAMLIGEEDTTISMINTEFEKLSGYSKEEVEGKKSWTEFLVKADLERMKGYHNLRMTDPNAALPLYEFQFIDKQGNVRDCLITLALTPGTKKTVGSLIDITKLKQSEEALRESKEQIRLTVENAPLGIGTAHLDGRFRSVNEAYCDMLGYSSEELLNMTFDDITHPDDKEKSHKAFRDLLEGKTPSLEFDKRYIHKDGSVIDVIQRGGIVYDLSGNPLFIIGISEDVTEKKKLQSQFQAAQRMEAIGTLAGGIAHNFNNVLMGIQGNTSLILSGKTSDHPDYDRLTNIEQGVLSGAELTKQLLGFARGGRYEVIATNLNELIKSQNGMFGRTKKQITIRGKYQDNPWTVEVDQGQINQVILNLYVNAWQAMPKGGDLYVQTENVSLDENYTKPFNVTPGRYVKISITDTGVGMDEETQRRIFEPFFTTKEMGKGTGLGLSSVYGIIKNHGGIINVYSNKGEGSTFTIYLPASEKEIVKEEKAPEKVIKGTETILLVGDEDMILDVGEQILKTMGYRS